MDDVLVDSHLKSLLASSDSNDKEPMRVLESRIKEIGFLIVEKLEKPWGATFRMSDTQVERFCELFFTGIDLPEIKNTTISPKLLLIAPGMRFSWQKHNRRAEFWRVVHGPVGLIRSDSDEQPQELEVFHEGETIDLPAGTRHRLVGLGSWGLIAEIWLHSDPKNPSDEADIVRLQDDFGR